MEKRVKPFSMFNQQKGLLMEILKKVENEFLNRSELELKVAHTNQPTPTKELLKLEVTKKIKVKPEKVEVKYIFSQKNRDYSIAKVFINQ